ncbi:RNA polymerase factor sigma-54 [Thermaurantiacus sp.]
MALGPRLDLRVGQTLILSPQLQAAIRLLALSNLELAAEIASELERNPILEAVADGEPIPPEAGPAGVATDPATPEPPLAAAPDLIAGPDRPDDGLDIDPAAEFIHHDGPADFATAPDADDGNLIERIGAPEESLLAVLSRQAESALAGRDLAIALAIIGTIDEAGYVTEPLEALAERLGIALGEVERVLRIVQGFEPTGVGARTLGECIALQAAERDRLDPCMAALLQHLDLVASGDLVQLRRVCDVDAEDLADMLRELRTYDPKPGLRIGGGLATPIVPDLFVRRTAKGFTVELNAETLPRLIVNRNYQAEIEAHARCHGSRAERQFLQQCVSQAQWLIRALDQRASTILKVATEIVAQQAAFFEHGISHLRPLTLRAVADATGVHESTVSRVTSNKFLSSERGTFELKFFFSSAVHTSGEDVAIAAVKARLKALIEAEDPLKPLSDDRLVDLLRREGYDLARRTVTKYREAMAIPSSFARRRRAIVRSA